MITIIGAGRVGSESAYNILEDRIGDIVLIDLQADLAKGEALDMTQAAPAIEFDGKIHGTADFADMEGSELVILIAGQARKPDMTRIDLMNNNAKIVRGVVKEIARYAPDCKLMIVTNPVDIMTYIARKESSCPRTMFSAWETSSTQCDSAATLPRSWEFHAKIPTRWSSASTVSPWLP